jgi:serine/threonine protein kinase
MGEVYRAHDTTLGRYVAIKVLPPEFANDPDRLLRFEREARVLASLNHPRIAAIYGVEHALGIRALVLELVEGQTVSLRTDGPRSRARPRQRPRLAIPLGKPDIASDGRALSRPRKGIVHRDLKPANVKLTEAS